MLPELKIRFVNVVDLFKLLSYGHPHGLTNQEYAALFTTDRPIIFNFHSYPWLIHRLTYQVGFSSFFIAFFPFRRD